MKIRFLILLSVIFALLQGPFLPPVFLEGLLAAMQISTKKGLGSLFLSGLIFDLVQGRTLGTTSLIFGAGFLVFLLFGGTEKNLWFLALIALVVDLARSQILFGQISPIGGIICFLATYLFFKYLHNPGGFLGRLA